jgi:hypothetical protein
MSDQNTTPPIVSTETIVEVAAINEAQTAEFNFKALVKAKVAEAQVIIKDNIVQTFADAEIARIETAVIKAVKDVDAARIEVKKIKPDVPETYDADGNVQTPATFSKATTEKIKAAKKVVTDLENAIQVALVKGDYSKVLQLADKAQKQ